VARILAASVWMIVQHNCVQKLVARILADGVHMVLRCIGVYENWWLYRICGCTMHGLCMCTTIGGEISNCMMLVHNWLKLAIVRCRYIIG
jgi:hypothetical protein